MSVTKFAAFAGAAVVVTLAVTLAMTQIMLPAQRFEDCIEGSVAGGNIGGPFELMDHRGQMVTDAQVLDQPALVYFGYTFCPDVCPMDVARNVVAVEILADAGLTVKPVFITIDPARDTVDYLADFVANNHPEMVGLTGTAEQIAKAARAYKVYYRKQPSEDEDYYLMDHSSFSYFMVPDVGFVDFLRSDLLPEVVADRLACVLRAS
ncbi:MAG: SCO family protein [Planktomarina sp.]|uniref:SCO family protein n=1 Tax=Planktomarina sp. TaxID=2024851 RepID=UPI00288D2079|nr:SCO family protein [Planktomarina sp.]MDG1293721.1 SCO family protein [Planktomarina sp.]MDT2030915.1 SCO family protein [Planktomarina sp.]MDT2070019.1 SCO family protein [Planktomarina sp.]